MQNGHDALRAALARYESTGDHLKDRHRRDRSADCPACAARRLLNGEQANANELDAYLWLNKMTARYLTERA